MKRSTALMMALLSVFGLMMASCEQGGKPQETKAPASSTSPEPEQTEPQTEPAETKVRKDPKTMSVTFIGDSITLGYALPVQTDRFTTVLANRYGFKEDNRGITGTLVAKAGLNNEDSFSYYERRILINRSDICVIFGGTNDYFWSDKPIDPPEGKENDVSYFSVALRKICEYAKEKREPGTTLLLTPYKHFGIGNYKGGADFRTSSSHPTSAVNYNGQVLEDYVNKILEIGAEYGIPVLDLYHVDGFDYKTMTIDGCHPNKEGHEWLADQVGPELEKLFGWEN